MTGSRRGNNEGTSPRKRADGRWQVQIRHTDESGVSKRSAVYGRTAAEARTKAKVMLARLADGQPARDRNVTVATFTREWITSTLAASERKETTKGLYANLAGSHIIPSKLGALPLAKLRASHVEAWVVELRATERVGSKPADLRTLADSTIRSTYTVLRSVLDTAVRDGALARNPAAAVKRPKVARKEAAHLSSDQLRAVLEQASTSRYASMFELLARTGMRRGEALALRWSDVDFTDSLLRVRGTLARVDGTLTVTAPKTTRSARFIPMSAEVESLLHQVKASQATERLQAGSVWTQTGFVFTTETGQPCDPRNALRALKAASARAGLPSTTLHTIRHSAASLMLVNGVPLKVVSDVLGHASVAITGDVYGHVSPDVSRTALAALSTALET